MGKKSSPLENEYHECAILYRFYHEIRLKTLGFLITLNGILLIAEMEHIQESIGKMVLAAFALIITGLALGLEIRTRDQARIAKKRLLAIEKDSELGYSTVTNLMESKGIRARIYFMGFYIATMIFWIGIFSINLSNL